MTYWRMYYGRRYVSCRVAGAGVVNTIETARSYFRTCFPWLWAKRTRLEYWGEIEDIPGEAHGGPVWAPLGVGPKSTVFRVAMGTSAPL
jgi:hypothetical protein